MGDVDKNNKGKHIFLDFINFNITTDLNECCENIFQIMKEGVALTKMKNMHSKMVVLDTDTEEGFTSVILLDESHITCHSYTKLGLLALDVFTCGKSDPTIISDYIQKSLQLKYPDIICTNSKVHKRFIY
jgi:S-adenosylmethionine decarboxylase